MMVVRVLVAVNAFVDGRAGCSLIDDEVCTRLGPTPAVDPATQVDQARWVSDASQRSALPALGADINEREQGLATEPRKWLLICALVVLWLVESIASIQVMRTAGVENPERIALGLMLAGFVFAATAGTARVIEQKVREVARASGDEAKRTRTPRWLFLGALTAYAVFILALALIRSDEAAVGDGSSRVVEWAIAVIMVAATVGPALLAEIVIRHLFRVAPAHNVLRVKRRQYRDLKKRVEEASERLDDLARRQRRYDADRAGLSAIYRRWNARGTRNGAGQSAKAESPSP